MLVSPPQQTKQDKPPKTYTFNNPERPLEQRIEEFQRYNPDVPIRISKRGRVNEGRPLEYKPEVLDITLDYIEKCEIPYIEELSLLLNVGTDTIVSWYDATDSYGKLINPEFTTAIKQLKAKNKLALMRGGVKGELNAPSSIFQLKVNHGMIETNRVEVDSNVNVSVNNILQTLDGTHDLVITDNNPNIEDGEVVS
jgi:hypothetical protein